MFPTWSEVLEVLRGLGYQKERRHRGRLKLTLLAASHNTEKTSGRLFAGKRPSLEVEREPMRQCRSTNITANPAS